MISLFTCKTNCTWRAGVVSGERAVLHAACASSMDLNEAPIISVLLIFLIPKLVTALSFIIRNEYTIAFLASTESPGTMSRGTQTPKLLAFVTGTQLLPGRSALRRLTLGFCSSSAEISLFSGLWAESLTEPERAEVSAERKLGTWAEELLEALSGVISMS